jgi:hypothetical protein
VLGAELLIEKEVLGVELLIEKEVMILLRLAD